MTHFGPFAGSQDLASFAAVLRSAASAASCLTQTNSVSADPKASRRGKRDGHGSDLRVVEHARKVHAAEVGHSAAGCAASGRVDGVVVVGVGRRGGRCGELGFGEAEGALHDRVLPRRREHYVTVQSTGREVRTAGSSSRPFS